LFIYQEIFGYHFFQFLFGKYFIYFISLGTFSCDRLSCVSNNAQSKKKHRNANKNNSNNTTTQTADEQNHILEFYIFDVTHERHINLTNDLDDKRLIILYNISNGLYTIGARNGKLVCILFLILIKRKKTRLLITVFFVNIRLNMLSLKQTE